MPLDKYKEKRAFEKTPEPTGGESNSDKLLFVVQKHAASHLHYDFRLELKGVLKSWAVPKGPSMNPAEHRLAQAVEDHPYDYKDFEGTIPKGQYGGGTVIIWDEGTYEPSEKIKGKKEQEHWIASHYYKNALKIKLNGKKLKGEFTLVRTFERGENSWLLSKVEDKHASTKDIREKDKSVVSSLTIEDMAANAEANVWQSNRKEQAAKKEITSKTPGKKAVHPQKVEPMLATLVREPFTNEDWLFEVKFDGYRIISHKDNGKVKLLSRKLDYTKNFKAVVEELSKLDHDFVMDGEVVVLDENGHPNFDALQKYKEGMHLAYYVFDLLWLEGEDLTRLPLMERRERLLSILEENDIIRYSRDFEDGVALFEAIKAQGLEGIMCKRKSSTYQAGKRSADWLKLPTKKVQDFVVGGWTESESGKAFRSLIFGNYRVGKFQYVGHVGGGFKETQRKEILADLRKLETTECPFVGKVETETKVHWLKPERVVIVEFATWTESGSIRKPATFKGFRSDKDPQTVTPEEPLSGKQEEEVVAEEKTASKQQKEKETETAEDSNWPEIEAEEIKSEGLFPIDGYKVKLYNIEKQVWKGIAKAKLIQYYHSVAPYILPYLRDRPLSLHIKNLGASAPGFYIKDMEGRQPEFGDIYSMQRKHKKKGKRNVIDYLVCNNEATLLYLINLGCVDLNPWNSRTASPENPDYVVIDLDPTEDDFKKVIETAKAAKEIFDKYKLKSFIKTSGKTGMHLVLPCSGFSYPQARIIAEKIGEEIQQFVPEISTTEITISKRATKLFIDPSQNDIADTIASAYSVRPFKHPQVSTPLEWKEVNDKLDPKAFTIDTIGKRLEKKGDLWEGLTDEKVRAANNKKLQQFL